MNKLLKHISPLAPDDSGACSVLYELGGITVICDAGGCAGNVCGFDEPRWFEKRSALFSAGLRDMDAILGRDDMLVKKLALVCQQVEAEFCAVVGTPVPAVIATDLKAIERMSEKKTGLPCIAVNTDGTALYDKGEEKAYLKIFQRFAEEDLSVKKGKLGVIGATPLNIGCTNSHYLLEKLKEQGYEDIVCFGMDSGINEVRKAGECEKLLVISPSGIKTAKYLNDKFATAYEVGFPCLSDEIVKKASDIKKQKVLIIHQQFAANALRDKMDGCEVVCASWFDVLEEYKSENDFHISGEQMLAEYIEQSGTEIVIADKTLKRAIKGFNGEFIDFPHYAVSGRLN